MGGRWGGVSGGGDSGSPCGGWRRAARANAPVGNLGCAMTRSGFALLHPTRELLREGILPVPELASLSAQGFGGLACACGACAHPPHLQHLQQTKVPLPKI
eukprot:scaffold24330_cov96-Isochrysis_galbana.AAC.1